MIEITSLPIFKKINENSWSRISMITLLNQKYKIDEFGCSYNRKLEIYGKQFQEEINNNVLKLENNMREQGYSPFMFPIEVIRSKEGVFLDKTGKFLCFARDNEGIPMEYSVYVVGAYVGLGKAEKIKLVKSLLHLDKILDGII